MIRIVGHRGQKGVIRRRVASVQGDHQVDPRREGRLLERGGLKLHPVETEALRSLSSARRQLGARFDGMESALLGGFEEQLIEDEPEVGVAARRIDHRGLGKARPNVVQGRLEKLNQVIDLFELSQGVGVQVSIAGEQVKLLEKLGRLTRQQLAAHPGGFDASTHGEMGKLS